MLYALALLAGIVAGSRVFTGIAAVSWAARLGALNLEGSWLAFMGYSWTPWIFTLLAIVELVTDQLPSTPSRKVPMQLGARVVSGALSGATIGVSAGSWIGGLIAGVIGAVIGTFGGAEIRATSRRRLGATSPPHSSRTPAPSSLGSSSSGRSDEPPFRRDRHRRRAGWTADGRPACGGGPEGRDHRARSDRRDLRQHRVHADQDAGRERLCGSSRAAGHGFRREGRAGRH